MPKKIDYIIYMEHRVREFDAAMLLHSNLKKIGYTGTIVPTHYNVRLNVMKYKPGIVIVPQCYSEKNDIFRLYEALYGKTFRRMNLHQEQITDKSGTEFMMPSDDYSRDMYHICWGQKFADQLLENGVDESRIFVTGSSRTDLIIKGRDNDFRRRASLEFSLDIKKKWLLFPMNFSLVFVDEEYLKGIENSGGRNVRQRVMITKKSMDAFFEVLNESIDNLKDYEIILRPHPYEDPNNYNEYLSKINRSGNVHLIRKYPVGNWIYESFRVINWTSTSALEAVIAEIPVANLQPVELDENFKMDYFRYLPLLKNRDDLLGFTKNGTYGDNGIDGFIKDTFYKLDGCSTQRICTVIKAALSENCSESDIKPNFKVYSRYLLLSLIREIPKLLLLKAGLLEKVLKKYKGLSEDYITQNEIDERILEKGLRKRDMLEESRLNV